MPYPLRAQGLVFMIVFMIVSGIVRWGLFICVHRDLYSWLYQESYDEAYLFACTKTCIHDFIRNCTVRLNCLRAQKFALTIVSGIVRWCLILCVHRDLHSQSYQALYGDALSFACTGTCIHDCIRNRTVRLNCLRAQRLVFMIVSGIVRWGLIVCLHKDLYSWLYQESYGEAYPLRAQRLALTIVFVSGIVRWGRGWVRLHLLRAQKLAHTVVTATVRWGLIFCVRRSLHIPL